MFLSQQISYCKRIVLGSIRSSRYDILANWTVLWLWGRVKWVYSENCFKVRINRARGWLDAACEKGQREPPGF